MVSGCGGGVRVRQPLRRWQEQRLRAQARIRRLRHFPTSSSSVDPCSAALSLSDSVPCGISAYSASCIWAQQRAQLFIGPGFRKELGLLFFRAVVCLFLYKKQWWENMRNLLYALAEEE